MCSRLTFVIDRISPSTTFTAPVTEGKATKCLSREMKIYRKSRCSPFSPLIDISSPSSRLHITYGSGKPFALHVRVTLVPSRTTMSLLVSVSTITGGTGRDFESQVALLCRKSRRAYRQPGDSLCAISWDPC